MFNSTQSFNWQSLFNLKRFYYNSLIFDISKFVLGVRWEIFYYISDAALCMNFVHTITPVIITLSMENKLEQCSKVLINCFDDWTLWSGNQTTCLDLS